MSLPLPWVDSLFTRLAVRYGAAWPRMWEGVDVALVKADWAHELGAMEKDPAAIAHGLDNLPPDRPPTVTQFRMLCAGKTTVYKHIPEPKADPKVAAAALASIQRPTGADPKEWAHELRRREQRCERLTKAQRDMWRSALGRTTTEKPNDR